MIKIISALFMILTVHSSGNGATVDDFEFPVETSFRIREWGFVIDQALTNFRVPENA